MAWKHLFGKHKGDNGTLAYFKTRLQRIVVSSEPKKALDACIDLLETVATGHWIACACDILGISSPDADIILPANLKSSTDSEKLLFVYKKGESTLWKLSAFSSK